ncbi:MAG: hypothetical protein IKH26_10800 [Bacteroidaceae bacterium]|nr:hypothetical protein [Bacteroidaceae bacterium]
MGQYRLIDPFCLFYLSQVEGRDRKANFWRDNENQPILNTWRGRAFENACLSHVGQIKAALGVGGITSENAPWTLKGMEGQKGMQLDLVISRADRVVNLCEMKFVAFYKHIIQNIQMDNSINIHFHHHIGI